MNNDFTRTDTLSYIHQMLAEMQRMARAADYPMLAYYITMAYTEADDTLRAEEQASDGEDRDGPS